MKDSKDTGFIPQTGMNGITSYDSSEDDCETEVMLYDRSKTRKIRHHLTRVEPTFDDGDNTSLMQRDTTNYFDEEGTYVILFTY